MDQEKQKDIALMRYAAITPVITGRKEEHETLAAFFRDACIKGVTAPDGTIKHYAPSTIKHWYHAYKRGGFEALYPKGRSDCGKPRKLDTDLQEQIRYLKQNYPRMSASAIFRQLQDNGSIKHGDISPATINRYINLLDSELRTTVHQDMRRYERAHINEVWCGDSSSGLYLNTADGNKRRVFILALIDDASRFIVGANAFFHDTFINLMSVMKSAVAKYGVPSMFNFDNGAAYRNKQMELLAARIGSTLHYCRPYTPTQKAKIERWFRTMKDQWMAALDMKEITSLDALRGNLFAYVQQYNQTPHNSLRRVSPQDRFFSESERIKRLSEHKLETAFLLEIQRRVSADNVIMINQVAYEVSYQFAKQRIRLRYAPDMKEIFVVNKDETLTPIRLLNKQENAVTKREKIHLSGGEMS